MPAKYQPTPLDNSRIELGAQLKELIEFLARNNHDLWARGRMEEGWRWGPQRNDETKETPMLIRYEELPESEKDYDRENAVETLKTIVALGYRIQPPERKEPQ